MTAQQLGNVLEAVVVAGFLLLIVFWVIRAVRLDALRQKLFMVRDEMFDFAASGHISFDDPAYRLLRSQMNGLIRYAHQFTLFRILMSVGVRKMIRVESSPTWNSAWQEALSKVENSQVRTQMIAFHDTAMVNALKHLITGSPVLLLATTIAMSSILLRHTGRVGFAGVRQLSHVAARRILIGPLDPRRLEEEAVCA